MPPSLTAAGAFIYLCQPYQIQFKSCYGSVLFRLGGAHALFLNAGSIYNLPVRHFTTFVLPQK